MLNPPAKLNPNIFETDAPTKPIRDGYGPGLVSAGEANPNVVALSADLTESTRTEAFAKKFPDRFFEVGVAEQNLATIAAGLGISGKIPFVASYATFSPGRNWEQIRTTIAYNDSNVKLAGHHAGLMTGPDGATHQALEDIALMRVLPNVRVIVPCDSIQAERATSAAAKLWGPVYLRFARAVSPVLTTPSTPFVPGKAQIFWTPKTSKKPDVVVFACGTLVAEALQAARLLEVDGVNSIVVNVHTVKPLDTSLILELAESVGAIVTAEEHQVAGGLGSAIAETLVVSCPTPQEFVGVADSFGASGTPRELMEAYGLTAKHIVLAAKRAVKRKKKH